MLMRNRSRVLVLSCFAFVGIALAGGGCRTLQGESAAAKLPTCLAVFSNRVENARTQLPLIIAAAEDAAARKLAHSNSHVNVTYGLQACFAEELVNRSGGLAEALPEADRSKLVTSNDIAVFSIRSWEKDGDKGMAFLKSCKEKGWMTILFASAKGKPANLEVDHFIDNGAKSGNETEAMDNLMANVLNGWLWVCEYTAALTRHGRHPGFLQSITTAGSRAHNGLYQNYRTRHQTLPCDVSLPQGDLSNIYLARVNGLIQDLSSCHTQKQIAQAANIIAKRLKENKKVFVSSTTHILLNELGRCNKTPWKPLFLLNNPKKVLEQNTQPGDLLVWTSFNGVSIWAYKDNSGPSALFRDFDTTLREAKLDLITSFSSDPLHPENNAAYALTHIEQPWSFGDAEVPVPFPPGRIAPVSGLCQALIWQMIDDATSDQLKP